MTMGCEAQAETLEFLRQFNLKVAERRIPLTGSLEITRRCNLGCAHCYLGSRPGTGGRVSSEVDSCRWRSIIDEVAASGCLYLLITGGEPLLRPDFPEIFRHARERGLLVSVFTNGTLVTDEVARLFQKWPPLEVEVSLYGATAATYERITGVPGSHARCLRGIERLIGAGVRVRLKTILMTLNSHEFTAIEQLARDWGVRFRFDPAIFPRLDGDRSPLALRVPAAEAIERELADRARVEAWVRQSSKLGGSPADERLYQCGAGMTGFHIDAGGELRPCLMTAGVRYNIRTGSFSEGWEGPLAELSSRRTGSAWGCQRCERKQVCDFCPSFFEAETGDAEHRSDYICSLAELRFQQLRTELHQGASNAR